MKKKPSEWTPQEAWNEAQKAMIESAVELNGKAIAWLNIPFPSDPPEVVEVDELRRMLEVFTPKTTMHMAVTELLARREAERKA